MGEYINKYANSAAIQNAVDGGELIKPYVALDESTGLIVWNSKSETDWSTVPLTFEILSDGRIQMYTNTITNPEYKLNNGEWTTFRTSGSYYQLNGLKTGDEVQIRASGWNFGSYNQLTCSSIFNLKGNIMSLINPTDFHNITTVGGYAFAYIFRDCTGLTDASELVLPATTLAQSCYSEMFSGCTSLTQAPELPATTLGKYCYSYMFEGCSNLNYIKCLATDISASDCTANWVRGVQTSSGTFVTPSSTAWSTGASGIPTNWTRVDA